VGNGGITPLFLTSALYGGEDQLHVPAVDPSGNSPLYKMGRRMGGMT
jgi:hypothetical protein